MEFRLRQKEWNVDGFSMLENSFKILHARIRISESKNNF